MIIIQNYFPQKSSENAKRIILCLCHLFDILFIYLCILYKRLRDKCASKSTADFIFNYVSSHAIDSRDAGFYNRQFALWIARTATRTKFAAKCHKVRKI